MKYAIATLALYLCSVDTPHLNRLAAQGDTTSKYRAFVTVRTIYTIANNLQNERIDSAISQHRLYINDSLQRERAQYLTAR